MVLEVRKAGFGCLLERCGTHHVHHTMIYTRYMSAFGHSPYQLFLRCCMWWLVIIQPLPPPGRGGRRLRPDYRRGPQRLLLSSPRRDVPRLCPGGSLCEALGKIWYGTTSLRFQISQCLLWNTMELSPLLYYVGNLLWL